MDSLYLQIVCVFGTLSSVYAATPTNCSYGRYCGIGGQCVQVNLVPVITQCVCYQGFLLSTQTFECEDIDECSEYNAAVCPRGHCVNIVGSYKCRCSKGYRPHHPDGKTCERNIYFHGTDNCDELKTVPEQDAYWESSSTLCTLLCGKLLEKIKY